MNQLMPNSIITVDSIVSAVEKAFAGRFENIDKQFKGIDKRFETMDMRFDAMDERFESIDRRFEGMDKRFDSLESRIEKKIEDSIGDLAVMTKREFDKVYVKLEEMDEHLVEHDEQFKIVNGKLNGLQGQIDNITLNFTMRREHEKLDKRVGKLEKTVFA